jgi:hypothetical protein
VSCDSYGGKGGLEGGSERKLLSKMLRNSQSSPNTTWVTMHMRTSCVGYTREAAQVLLVVSPVEFLERCYSINNI